MSFFFLLLIISAVKIAAILENAWKGALGYYSTLSAAGSWLLVFGKGNQIRLPTRPIKKMKCLKCLIITDVSPLVSLLMTTGTYRPIQPVTGPARHLSGEAVHKRNRSCNIRLNSKCWCSYIAQLLTLMLVRNNVWADRISCTFVVPWTKKAIASEALRF